MKVLGFRTLKIEQLCLTGDFRARLDNPRIFERARSIERVGILSEPMVRQVDHRVIYGHDRIAAAIRCGFTEVLCKLVECSDEELYEIELTENAHRRHDVEAQREGLLKVLGLYEEQIEVNPHAAPLTDPTRGRSKTARGLARVRVANESGIKPESVRMAEFRAKRAAEKAKTLKSRQDKRVVEREAKNPTITINLIGMEVEDEFTEQVERIGKLLGEADSAMRRAQGALGNISSEKLPYPAARLQRLLDDVHAAASAVRVAKPVALCPYCKGLPKLQDECAACLQSGWVSLAQSGAVPKDLWTEGAGALVAYRGTYVRVSEFLGELANPEPIVERVLEQEPEEFFA